MKTFYPLALSMVALALVTTACGDDELNVATTSSTGGASSSSVGGSDGGGGTGMGGNTSQGGGGAGMGGMGQGGQGGGAGGQGGGMATGSDCLMCLQAELSVGGNCEGSCGADAPCAAYLVCLADCSNTDFTQACFTACETNNASAATTATQTCLETECNTAADCASVW